MVSTVNAEELRESIKPKSDQLNADDLILGPITVTVQEVKRGDREQPVSVVLDNGYQPFKPCKSMRRVLISAWSDDPRKWVGERMTLYRDPEVKFGGVKVGGIRISHLSGIDEDKTFVLTRSRGSRSEYLVKRLGVTLTEQDQAYIAGAKQQIADAVSREPLKTLGEDIAKHPKAVQDAIRPAFEARWKELAPDVCDFAAR